MDPRCDTEKDRECLQRVEERKAEKGVGSVHQLFEIVVQGLLLSLAFDLATDLELEVSCTKEERRRVDDFAWRVASTVSVRIWEEDQRPFMVIFV